MLTEIPGAGARVAPFWSPDGDSLAFMMVHLEEDMSAIVLVEKLEGEGEVVYESPLLDLPEAPLWLGREVVFFRALHPEHEYTAAGPLVLALLQLDGGAHEALTQPGDLEGRLRLIDARTIAIDAVGAAYRVRLTRA